MNDESLDDLMLADREWAEDAIWGKMLKNMKRKKPAARRTEKYWAKVNPEYKIEDADPEPGYYEEDGKLYYFDGDKYTQVETSE